jgi:23S rRNA (uracil1939-C5)-methyltransferase
LHAAVETALQAEPFGTARSLAGLRVLELYAGSGALALRLAARGARVTLVESFVPAVRLAERAAGEQNLELTPVAADAGEALTRLASAKERFDAVIVDPPRRGLAPEVRRLIAALAPERLIYVSCAPETLARDAAHFAMLGYGLADATPFDMIPQTDAVETLARFVRRPAPEPPVLGEDATFVAVDKPPHVAAAAPRSATAVPLAALDDSVSGVSLFARSQKLAPALEGALRSATAEYVLLARGIVHARGNLSLKGRKPGARVRYERRRVVSGHSLLTVHATPSSAASLFRALAHIGHPVLGDARHGDRRSNTHLSHRYGLDRPFFHRRALELTLASGQVRLEAPLAPDLEAVLAALESSEARGETG